MRPTDADKAESSPADKLRLALDLYDDGVAMMRLRLTRQFGPEEAAVRLDAWLRGDMAPSAIGTWHEPTERFPSAR